MYPRRTNMADGGSQKSQKSGYQKSKIPVLSRGYKRVMKDVKAKREKIEKLESECEVLKAEIKSKTEEFQSAEQRRQLQPAQVDSEQFLGSPHRKSEIRTTLITPKGTKRRVRTSHCRFQSTLAKILQQHVICERGRTVLVDELLDTLKSYSDFKAVERKTLLTEVSAVLGKKVKRRGRKEPVSYYEDVKLVVKQKEAVLQPIKSGQSGANLSTDVTSPKSKLPKYDQSDDTLPKPTKPPKESSYVTSKVSPACQTRLSFEGMGDFSTASTSSIQDLEDELSVMEISEGCLADVQKVQSESERLKGAEVAKKQQTATTKSLVEQIEELNKAFSEHVSLADKVIEKQQSIIETYKDISQEGRMLGGMLSISERNAIKNEICSARKIFNLGLRDKEVMDMCEILSPLLFSNMLSELKQECPTIVCILEQLVLSSNASRNTMKTPEMKMKAAVHLLSSLMDVRDQHASNDVPILFGLLCLCFGAGPSMIDLLQRLGLSESHPVLIKFLKSQLLKYKDLIAQRVAPNTPVITYQDNLQLMRTSLRHLRLGKLQKEKAKQNKMWDFTVRGWRVADVTGQEDLFNTSTAVEPQRTVKDLEYEDLLIENNEDHKQKWHAFQERNLLRKMDMALNDIPLSKEEITVSENAKLQEVASAVPPKDAAKVYKIRVPQLEEEFHDMGKKPAKIFPLPISYENQCSTMGVASNLDIFQREFNFQSAKSEKYLPLKSSGKEFDLEQAYKRFAFMRKLEQHKLNQQEYEKLLRGDEQKEDNNASNDIAIHVVEVRDLSDSDEDSDQA